MPIKIFKNIVDDNIDNTNINILYITETKYIAHWYYTIFVQKHINDIDYILTYDQDLINKFPEKSIFIPHCSTELPLKLHNIFKNDINIEDQIKMNEDHIRKEFLNTQLKSKDKLCCMIASNKKLNFKAAPGHYYREKIYSHNYHQIDYYGKITNKRIENKSKVISQYFYAVEIENNISECYFTEKLIHVILNKTIPIYRGSRQINKFFDTRGFILFETLDEFNEIIHNLTIEHYYDKLEYVKKNFKTVLDIHDPIKWVYKNHLLSNITKLSNYSKFLSEENINSGEICFINDKYKIIYLIIPGYNDLLTFIKKNIGGYKKHYKKLDYTMLNEYTKFTVLLDPKKRKINNEIDNRKSIPNQIDYLEKFYLDTILFEYDNLNQVINNLNYIIKIDNTNNNYINNIFKKDYEYIPKIKDISKRNLLTIYIGEKSSPLTELITTIKKGLLWQTKIKKYDIFNYEKKYLFCLVIGKIKPHDLEYLLDNNIIPILDVKYLDNEILKKKFFYTYKVFEDVYNLLKNITIMDYVYNI